MTESSYISKMNIVFIIVLCDTVPIEYVHMFCFQAVLTNISTR